MHSCNEIQTIIENFLAGEISPSEKQLLDEHLVACADCRALMALHEELTQIDADVVEPGPGELRALRSRVLAQTARQGSGGGARPLQRSAWVFGSAVATAALLVLGVFLGRWISAPQGLDDRLLLRAVAQQANSVRSLEDYWDAPLSFANVDVGDLQGGRVDLGFDVCRSLDLNVDLDSAVAGEVLTHAIFNANSLGGRLRAIELAAKSENERLTDALLLTLRHDPDPTLRIEALSALADNKDSDRVQTALLASLRDDESVQVRMMVLDHLVNQALGLDTLEEVIREGNSKTNSAVYQRARELKNSADDEWL